MATDGVACSRCGETFETQDGLILHSVETHTGEGLTTGSPGVSGARPAAGADRLDPELVEELLHALEERTTAPDRVLVRYGQRFLAAAGLATLAIVLVLTYLRATGTIDVGVYLFSLGTLFGLALSYLQAFIQASRDGQ